MKRIFDRVLDIAAIIAVGMIVFAMLTISTGVVTRYFLGESLTWVVDVCAILLVYITFLGSAWLLRSDGHVKVDLILRLLNPRSQSIFNVSTSILGVLMFAFITWYGAKYTWINIQSNYWMPTQLETPRWLIMVIVPIGSFLLFIQFLRRTYGHLKSRKLPVQEGREHKPEA